MNEIIYFELNNWVGGDDYPFAEPFLTWCGNDEHLYFNDEKWVKENKLCVVKEYIDMSNNWCVTATREWVEQNCPDLLSDSGTFTTTQVVYKVYYTSMHPYCSFLRIPDPKTGVVKGQFGTVFLEYSEDNIGIHCIEDGEDEYGW